MNIEEAIKIIKERGFDYTLLKLNNGKFVSISLLDSGTKKTIKFFEKEKELFEYLENE